MKSILQTSKECYVCGSVQGLEEHHIYFGKNRTNSERYGFKAWLCYEHHRGTYGVHGKYGSELDTRLKITCQQQYELTHSREGFMAIIGRNYL